MKKAISLLLVLAICSSLCVTAFATGEPVDSTGSVVDDIDKTLPEEMTGQDPNQGATSNYESVGSAGNQDVEVYVTKASTYTITIPKTVILSGNSNTATGAYTVKVTGDISGLEVIKVKPDASFALKHAGKADITANVEQDKTIWQYANLSIDGVGTITAEGLSAGMWSGSFKFNIARTNTLIPVVVIDAADIDLNATFTIIAGEQRVDLLSKLEESGLFNNFDGVDALIDVKADHFEGTATAIFDVTNIAEAGDKLMIVHFNETTQEWEFIAEVEVDAEGKATAQFASFSPVALIVVGEDDTVELSPSMNPALNHNGIIPIGATYTTANGDIYKAGENFPQEVSTGDIYTYGDYEYRYNMYKEIRGDWCEFSEWWYYCTIDDGWGMIYTGENKSRPNNPLWQINGKDVTCAIGTYLQHLEIEAAPVLPETLKNMAYTFSGCENLKEAPHIPASVIEIAHCFFDNYALIEPPVLSHCENLYTTEGMFWNCDKITTLPVLPNSVVEASSMFEDCSSIVDASDFVVPENIVDMYAMFAYCENLKYAPVIPEHVTSIWRTFRKCTSLEGTIIINSNITKYTEAFEKVDMSKIIIAGFCDTTTKQAIANTGINGNNVTIIE